MITLATVGYMASTAGLVFVSAIDPSTAGELASKLGVIGILGASNVYLGRALAKVYKDNRAQDVAERAKLITLIETSAATNQAVMRAIEMCHSGRNPT